MFHWLWVILIGFLAGVVAKMLSPGAGPSGFIVTSLLGIAGSVLASALGQAVGWYAPGTGAGFIGSIVGAVLLLAVYRRVAK